MHVTVACVLEPLFGHLVHQFCCSFAARGRYFDYAGNAVDTIQVEQHLFLGIVFGNQQSVVEGVLQHCFEGLQATKVNNPIAHIQSFRLENKLESQCVSVKETAMRICTPLTEAATEAHFMAVRFRGLVGCRSVNAIGHAFEFCTGDVDGLHLRISHLSCLNWLGWIGLSHFVFTVLIEVLKRKMGTLG